MRSTQDLIASAKHLERIFEDAPSCFAHGKLIAGMRAALERQETELKRLQAESAAS